MLQAIIFDFDGVIADTERLHLRAFAAVLDKRGVMLDADDYYSHYLGMDDYDVLRAVVAACGLPRDEARLTEMIEEKIARYGELIATAPVLIDGVAARVREWSRQVRLAIASGALRHEIEGILGRADLLSCFETIVAAKDVRHGKPAPDPYLEALERLRHREPIEAGACIVIEDAVPGIEAARAAGMRVVGVTTNHPAERLAGADLVVASVAALNLRMLEAIVAR